MATTKHPDAPRFPPAGTPLFRFRWRTRKTHPDRFGQDCRIVSRIQPGQFRVNVEAGSIVVEFPDGLRVTTFRGSIRLKTPRRFG